MQTCKSRPGSLDVPQKPSSVTPHTTWKPKTTGSGSDHISSPNPVKKLSKDRRPKVTGRQQIPANEKKLGRVSELESRIAQLHSKLKMAEDQLNATESLKMRAQQEAEDASKQLMVMSATLEETRKQLKEISDSEEERIQELRKISQDRDRAWQSELEAVKKHHSMDSAALASAINEIQRLKIQLDRVSESEVSHARHAGLAHAEIQSLRLELVETLELVEKLKTEIIDSHEYESQAMEEASRAQMHLEVVKATEESLLLEHDTVMESYKSLVLELKQSKNRTNSLEELVETLRADLSSCNRISVDSSHDIKTSFENGKGNESEELNTELNNLRHEVAQLQAAVEDVEGRYRDEYIQSTLKIRNAYELAETVKSESWQKKGELEVKLEESLAEVETLRTKLIEQENAFQQMSSENLELFLEKEKNKSADRESELETELKTSESALDDLKACLLDKETLLQIITQENEMLKYEILNWEMERNVENDEAFSLAERAKSAEHEILLKLSFLTEEADKSSRKAERVTEQLNAVQATNLEMEAELRRLTVQLDQWRKAAEAAAAMLSTENNNKCIERAVSLDYYYTVGGKLGSPFSDDTEHDSPGRKNTNVLKKIGLLLKKGQR